MLRIAKVQIEKEMQARIVLKKFYRFVPTISAIFNIRMLKDNIV